MKLLIYAQLVKLGYTTLTYFTYLLNYLLNLLTYLIHRAEPFLRS